MTWLRTPAPLAVVWVAGAALLFLLLPPSPAVAEEGAPDGTEEPSVEPDTAPPAPKKPLPTSRPKRKRKAISWEWFTLDGYLRTRAGLMANLDLDRGPTTTTGQPIFPVPPDNGQWLGSADARGRVDLGIHVGDVVRAQMRIDVLDGLVLGSTPEGLPPSRWSQSAWASVRQEPPSAGRNAFVDSIRLKQAYGEVLTPIGLIAFGRMRLPGWGLGIVTGPPEEDLDDDFDDSVDRLAFATSIAEHLVGVSFDINAVGPTSASSTGGDTASRQPIDLELQDNVYTLSLAFGRLHDAADLRRRGDAGKATFSYGAYATWRWQSVDFPGYYLRGLEAEDELFTDDDAVPRRMNALLGDLWLRLHAGPVRLEFEGAYGWARVGDPSVDPGVSLPPLRASQFGAVFEAEVEALPDRLWVELGIGFASGDPAPGLGVAPPVGQIASAPGDFDGPQFNLGSDNLIQNFRFHPNYRVDEVFWRQLAGAVTDAVYLRPELRFEPNPTVSARLSAIASFAASPSSTPSGQSFYGAEIDLSADWTPVPGFQARGTWGLFLPGPALDHPTEGHRAQPGSVFRLVLAVLY